MSGSDVSRPWSQPRAPIVLLMLLWLWPALAPSAETISDADIEQVRFIKRLVDDLGVNLAGVEVIIQLRSQIIALREELGQRSLHHSAPEGAELLH